MRPATIGTPPSAPTGSELPANAAGSTTTAMMRSNAHLTRRQPVRPRELDAGRTPDAPDLRACGRHRRRQGVGVGNDEQHANGTPPRHRGGGRNSGDGLKKCGAAMRLETDDSSERPGTDSRQLSHTDVRQRVPTVSRGAARGRAVHGLTGALRAQFTLSISAARLGYRKCGPGSRLPLRRVSAAQHVQLRLP